MTFETAYTYINLDGAAMRGQVVRDRTEVVAETVKTYPTWEAVRVAANNLQQEVEASPLSS